jgi:hypothetical protein
MEFKSYSLQRDELEDLIDTVKLVVVGALVKEKIMKEDEADKWCEDHTIIIRKKTFFKTISDKWFNKKEEKNDLLIVVKKVI